MTKTTYKGKSREELLKALVTKRADWRDFRFGEAGSKTRQVKEGREIKKDIARIMTELSALKSNNK